MYNADTGNVECDTCGVVLAVGQHPYCPHDYQASSVIGDDIPGGVEIKNALCNADGTPRRYYSKTEIAKEAAKRGWTNYVVHRPPPGSDKSVHTQRFI